MDRDPKEALRRFIRAVMRDTTYHVQYAATVQLQHADGPVDLLADDERVRGTGLSRVPIRHGLPGVEVRVLVGARVLLGFENGDPRRPFASLWEPGSIDYISFNGGQSPIAGVGDTATVFWPPEMTIIGTVTIGGTPCAFQGLIAITSPSVAIIESGADRLLVGPPP